MSGLWSEIWGSGAPVVLVHGSLATGVPEWAAQASLAEQGFRLVVVDRRGYGRSPASAGEDFVRDADDIVTVMGDGAHLVGHSYGGLGTMLAAASRPELTWSLTLLEPPVFTVAPDDDIVESLVNRLRSLFADHARADAHWVAEFLDVVGSDASELPDGMLDEILPLVPVLRRGRAPWDHEFPLAELKAAGVRSMVVSGNHSGVFEATCDALADQIGADRMVVEGAGHEIQFTGQPLNEALLRWWRSLT